MRRVKLHVVSAYDMHPSLHMKRLVVLPMLQVVPLDCHEFLPRLCTSSRRVKHLCMLHSTLYRVTMLSQQPLALSNFASYVILTNISTCMLLICIKDVNRSYDIRNWLDLLFKVSTPKLREWGTNYLDKNLYLPFYPPNGSVSSCHVIQQLGSMSWPIHVGSTW